MSTLLMFYRSVYALDARCYHAGGPLWKGHRLITIVSPTEI